MYTKDGKIEKKMRQENEYYNYLSKLDFFFNFCTHARMFMKIFANIRQCSLSI